MTDENLKIAIERLYHWQNQAHSNNFTSRLYELFEKADRVNRNKLHLVFPDEGYALDKWKSAGNNGDDLFREFGLMK